MDVFLNAKAVAPIEQLKNYFEWFLEFFEQNVYALGRSLLLNWRGGNFLNQSQQIFA